MTADRTHVVDDVEMFRVAQLCLACHQLAPAFPDSPIAVCPTRRDRACRAARTAGLGDEVTSTIDWMTDLPSLAGGSMQLLHRDWQDQLPARVRLHLYRLAQQVARDTLVAMLLSDAPGTVLAPRHVSVAHVLAAAYELDDHLLMPLAHAVADGELDTTSQLTHLVTRVTTAWTSLTGSQQDTYRVFSSDGMRFADAVTAARLV